jgi:signal peptidase I
LILINGIFSFMVIDGVSMDPTLRSGEIVLVLRLGYGLRLGGAYLLRWAEPKREDLVAFRNPSSGRQVVKRCVGVGGDPLFLEGSSSLRVADRVFGLTTGQDFHFLSAQSVPKRCFFMVGDNPSQSLDSREYGPVAIDSVLGRVVVLK